MAAQPTDPKLTDPERRTESALFRYTLILPLLGEPSPKAKQQMRQNIAAIVYDLPHSKKRRASVSTLRRWERNYGEGALKRSSRNRAPTGDSHAPSPARPWSGWKPLNGNNLSAPAAPLPAS